MKKQTHKLALSAMFIALGFLAPFIIGNDMALGSMFLPMHIPILLCGFIVGGLWGGVVGATVPLLRTLILGVPPIYPMSIAMSAELAVYGLVAGVMYYLLVIRKKANTYDARHLLYTYVSLIVAMLAGRAVFGGVMYVLSVMSATRPTFTMSAFIAGAFTTPWLGIVIQLALIPPIVIATKKAMRSDRYNEH
ncbi:MAG: ECF transporter S component [Oscillospiraceae bacterium]|nr:ECF transporter S component [Oscillospiraceae bacterium]